MPVRGRRAIVRWSEVLGDWDSRMDPALVAAREIYLGLGTGPGGERYSLLATVAPQRGSLVNPELEVNTPLLSFFRIPQIQSCLGCMDCSVREADIPH